MWCFWDSSDPDFCNCVGYCFVFQKREGEKRRQWVGKNSCLLFLCHMVVTEPLFFAHELWIQTPQRNKTTDERLSCPSSTEILCVSVMWEFCDEDLFPVKETWLWPWLIISPSRSQGWVHWWKTRVSVLRHRSAQKNNSKLSVGWETESKRRREIAPRAGHPVKCLYKNKIKSSIYRTISHILQQWNKKEIVHVSFWNA